MAERIINFNPGPAALPLDVLEEAKDEMLDYKGSGMSVAEISHRSTHFDDILNEMMDEISEEEFYKNILEEHRAEVKKIRKGEYLTEDDLEDFLESD